MARPLTQELCDYYLASMRLARPLLPANQAARASQPDRQCPTFLVSPYPTRDGMSPDWSCHFLSPEGCLLVRLTETLAAQGLNPKPKSISLAC